MTSVWTRQQIGSFRPGSVGALPVIDDRDVVAVADGIDIWDSWPIRTRDGSLADVCGHVVWIALAAPNQGDPGLRHDIAHHRALVAERDGSFLDLGPLFGDSVPLGTRQWAGSAVLDRDVLTAYYTAAGTPGSDPPGFRQRLAAATATLECGDGATPHWAGWSAHVEILQPDPQRYDSADEADGKPGFIKAFRDPFPFVDPASGEEYLLFTGSLPNSSSTTDFNGLIGIARRRSSAIDDWEILDPLVTADGVNNELERPHVVVRDGRYYVFFSTQKRTFHPDVIAPTGLYGFVADTLRGSYRPLNGHGVVFTNPPHRALQAYSWLVLNDLSVIGFVDGYGIDTATGQTMLTAERDARKCQFGGTFSPTVHIALEADRAWLIET